MTGLCGVFGGDGDAVEHLADGVRWSGRETTSTYTGEDVGVHVTDHPQRDEEQPVQAGDALLWLLGDVYGVDTESGYVSRPADTASVAFCASLYERRGRELLPDLNGNFAGVIYDRSAETASVFVDRFGSRAVFRARPNGAFVFSTQIQTLGHHPDVDLAFDREYLFEYLTLRRVFGNKSPLQGVEKLHPASVTTVDLESDEVERNVYWEPSYRPTDASFDVFLDRFVETFQTVVDEWLERRDECGLLLSGGSDSRLILAAADRSLTAFHLTDWWSDEARTAERVARTADAEFRLLQRTDDYYRTALERNAPLSNFDGYFFQGYSTPFEGAIVDAVEGLMSGLYADTLFKSESLPTRTVSLTGLGTHSLPFSESVESTTDVVDRMIDGASGSLPSPPAYLDVPTNMRDVMSRHVTRRDGRIDHHGVEYDSLAELVVSNRYYPLSNDTELIYSNSLHQLLPYRSPYLDNRLVDLHLRMPKKYRLRRNPIKQAVRRLDPELAELPHASTGVAVSRPFPHHYLARRATAFRRKYLPFDRTPPEPYHGHDSWRNHATFVRHDDFVGDALAANERTIRALPFLDMDGVEATYRTHLDGEDRTAELYTLVTFLEMPVTKTVAARATDVQGSPRPNGRCRS